MRPLAARSPLGKTLLKYYGALERSFGPQSWWPAETPFEVMVGAILTQNTAWSNVEKAIRNLKSLDLLDAHRLDQIDRALLARAIRPTGYFNVKAQRLKSFIRWFVDRYDGKIERMKERDPAALREELLEVKGIGKETADSILLYALNVPTFVIDLYTYRVLTRHALCSEEATYDDMKDLFEQNLRPEVQRFNEFHALLVATGKNYCRPKPLCEQCPLQRYLPR